MSNKEVTIKFGAKQLDFTLDNDIVDTYYKLLTPYYVDQAKNEKYLVKLQECSNKIAYLWKHDKMEAETDADKDFIAGKLKTRKLEAIGVHSCGSYMMFKPDIIEVINLLFLHVQPSELQKIRDIYVTTEPYPSLGHECILKDGLGHYGKTTFHIVYRDNTDGLEAGLGVDKEEEEKDQSSVKVKDVEIDACICNNETKDFEIVTNYKINCCKNCTKNVIITRIVKKD